MLPAFYAFLIIFNMGRVIFELGEYYLKVNICRKLCQKLNFAKERQSKKEEGTTICLETNPFIFQRGSRVHLALQLTKGTNCSYFCMTHLCYREISRISKQSRLSHGSTTIYRRKLQQNIPRELAKLTRLSFSPENFL